MGVVIQHKRKAYHVGALTNMVGGNCCNFLVTVA